MTLVACFQTRGEPASASSNQHRCRRVLVSVVLNAGLAFVLSGCLAGRSFHTNDSIVITAPVEGDFAEAPLTVQWTSADPSVTRFAVFVDRPPLAPQQSVDELENQERDGVYLTDQTELALEFVPPRRTPVASRKDIHRITVVALKANGERVDDAGASVELTVVQP